MIIEEISKKTKTLRTMEEKFTAKERKKEFYKVFKERILPFFENYGFARHTKTSKRLFKEFRNGLSVYIIFDYISFGSGFYTFSVVYFDDEIGDVYNDNYLVMVSVRQLRQLKLKAKNAKVLYNSLDLWFKEVEEELLPLIKKYTTHKAILNDIENFYVSSAREEWKEILKRKSKKT